MAFLLVENYTIHFEIAGEGPPLLILHGMGNNSQSWKKQLKGLSEQFTVIAWDAPGYGKSSDPNEELKEFKQFADVLKGFIENLNYKSVTLLGHSMGSAIAIEFCYRFPHMVDALIISDATRGSAALSKEENERKLKNRLNNIESLSPSELANLRVKELLSPDPKPEVLKEAERIYSQIRPMGFRSVAYSLFHLNNMEILPAINVPTLVICGEQDKVTPVSESLIFHAHIQDSHFVTIPNTGHLCYQEDPESFNSIIIDFLTSIGIGKNISLHQ
ncbi:alpha/beta fold hydrolase [Neobacillus ginsengisoli]|uniref:Pimeloyl-ACP methyl ester carboxylesterase n=1 Tax=Neobacillus ginsengisoli TaxID=904295 RepID=A0ABT9Y460_9BACI|nr:alpha/beta hydrolase [Neobacillus ginsengisoli]MDQ0201929.1 pimeloyl-ACP methyl ester carboxylesterase [Neobacillus ginsengisoli]